MIPLIKERLSLAREEVLLITPTQSCHLMDMIRQTSSALISSLIQSQTQYTLHSAHSILGLQTHRTQ